MHLLVDAQLPPALAKWLIGRGHVAAHDLRLASSTRRSGHMAAIVTKD